MIVVSDTSPLSNLALVDGLFLLKEIYNTVVIPQAVAEELSNAEDEEQQIAAVLSLDWIEVRQATNLELIAGLRNDYLLDRGEAEAIALALELKADELLIDERLGRREATRLGLSITGVLGVLLIAKRRKLIPAVQQPSPSHPPRFDKCLDLRPPRLVHDGISNRGTSDGNPSRVKDFDLASFTPQTNREFYRQEDSFEIFAIPILVQGAKTIPL